MTTLAERATQLAHNLLMKYGQTVTITRQNVFDVNTNTGNVLENTPQTFTAYAYVTTNIAGKQQLQTEQFQNINVERNYYRIILESKNDYIPEISDVLNFGDRSYSVIGVNKTFVNEFVVLYYLDVGV